MTCLQPLWPGNDLTVLTSWLRHWNKQIERQTDRRTDRQRATLACLCVLAWCDSSRTTACCLLYCVATCSAVRELRPSMSTLLQRSNNVSTTDVRPYLAATCSAVKPRYNSQPDTYQRNRNIPHQATMNLLSSASHFKSLFDYVRLSSVVCSSEWLDYFHALSDCF